MLQLSVKPRESVTAGEEGNAFYIGDDHFILGADSLCQHFAAHCLLENQTRYRRTSSIYAETFQFECFREHMMEDNFSVQAVLRADSQSVKPECFNRTSAVRSPQSTFSSTAQTIPRQKRSMT